MLRKVALGLKHLFDRIAATVSIVVMAPLWLIIPVAIRLDSCGPVFFIQWRVGKAGKRFRIYKFRSMVVNADSMLSVDGMPSTPRITRFGRLLRQTSLDELPQLFNILRGDMSFVGPRPILPENLSRYQTTGIRRFEMKPGITGLAQINGRNQIPWSKRVEYDLTYIENWSIKLDLKILLRTFGVVLTGSGHVLDRNLTTADDLSNITSVSSNGATTRFVERMETKFTGRFKKEVADESFLSELNECLCQVHHDKLLHNLPEQPTIHVLGIPRSGTTLMTQVLASRYCVGHINHLIASFWKAPVFGIRLSEKLIGDSFRSSFDSDYGRTGDLTEPHEFGYFWKNLLGYPEMRRQNAEFDASIDWNTFRLVMLNMGHAFGRPLVMKSFLLAWHMAAVQRSMPKSLFVWVRRPLVDAAKSLLKARQEQTGDVRNWVSLQPVEYDWLQHETPEMQVAGQVYFLNRAIEQQAACLPDSSLVLIDHQKLLSEPEVVAQQVAAKVASLDCFLESRNSLPKSFAKSSTLLKKNDPVTAKIEAALDVLRAEHSSTSRKAA